jgi:hypothetical protein
MGVLPWLSTVSYCVACTLCSSASAIEVRGGLLDDKLLLNLAATVSPFVAVAVIVAWVHLGSPLPRRRHGNPRR